MANRRAPRRVGKIVAVILGLCVVTMFIAMLATPDQDAVQGRTATIAPTKTTVPTATVAPTKTAAPTATDEPTSVPVAQPAVRSNPVPTVRGAPSAAASSCDCASGDTLNCGDFPKDGWDAQACYMRCMELAGRDVHRLDGDKDGSACEWTW